MDNIVRNPHVAGDASPTEDYQKTIFSEKADRSYVKGTIIKTTSGGFQFTGTFKTGTNPDVFTDAANLTDDQKAELQKDFEKERKDLDGDGSRAADPRGPGRIPCGQDTDGDVITNADDNCPHLFNPGQIDSDCDGFGDLCDICPGVYNPGQEDCNGDGLGDACEGGGTFASLFDDFPSLPIPDNDPAGVSTTIDVPDSGVIADLDVELEISHSRQSDLIVELAHAGTTITLIFRPGTSPFACDPLGVGYSAADFGLPGDPLILDDCAPEVIDCYDGTGPGLDGFSGPAHPNRLLEAFAGTNKAGVWTLTVFDASAGDSGTLNSWALRFEELNLPNDGNVNGIPDECEGPIPAVSEWGLMVMTLLILTAGTIVLGRRRRPEAA